MAALVFADSGTYLDFYEKGRPKFASLIATLERLGERLLITERVVNEVRRRKLDVAIDPVKDLISKIKTYASSLPPSLSDFPDPDVRQAKDACAKLYKDANALVEQLTSIRDRALAKIARSEDEVSIRLEKLFARAAKATPEQVSRAILRAQYGDPPGKKGGVGDQLSWEQLVDAYNPDEGDKGPLCIITHDRDYFVELGKHGPFPLNPVLAQEMHAKGALDKVFVFNDLLTGVQFLEEKHGMRLDVPRGEEAEAIRKEERKIGALQITGVSVTSAGTGTNIPIPVLLEMIEEGNQ